MGFFSDIFGFLFLVFFGGTGRNGRHHRGLFGTDGHNPFVSKPIRGHQDPWSRRRTGPRNPFIGRNRSFPPKSGGRNLPKDPWKKKYDSVMGTTSHAKRYTSGSARPLSNSMTAGHYGHRGEFDTNDAIRAKLEDMEQYYAQDKDFDAFDQGYEWDEIVDAANDEYLPQDYLDNLEKRENDQD